MIFHVAEMEEKALAVGGNHFIIIQHPARALSLPKEKTL